MDVSTDTETQKQETHRAWKFNRGMNLTQWMTNKKGMISREKDCPVTIRFLILLIIKFKIIIEFKTPNLLRPMRTETSLTRLLIPSPDLEKETE